ncbi:MAG: MATE family efflux transporter, partial [Bacteroidota bacterium]
VESGALCLQIIAVGYVFYAYGMVVTNAFNGAGDTRTPTVINLCSFWFFQLPIAYLLAIVLDLEAKGVFIAITAAEVLLATMAMIWFKKGRWKTVKV